MRKYRAEIVLLLLVLIFFIPEIIQSKVFLYGDNLSPRIQTLGFYSKELQQFRLPLWNPYILGGIPFLADLSNNALAPTNLFYFFFSPAVAMFILSIFLIWVAAVFTFRLVFSLTKNIYASTFSAIVYSFSGSVTASINDINSLQGIAYIPLVIFSAHYFISKPTIKKSYILIFCLLIQFFSSHPQYSYYTWLITALYLLSFIKEKFKKKLAWIVSVFIIFFSLSAIQLIPFLELSSKVFRPGSEEFSTQNQLQLIELPRLLIAQIYGSWKEGSSWGPGSQLETGLANTEGYMSLFSLFFALFAVFKVKQKTVKFWALLALFAFLISLGNQTPIYEFLINTLPLFDKFRSPVRILSYYSFSISILAGLGLNRIINENRNS